MSDLSFSKVSLLLHGEGANGSTVFTDSSPRAKAISQVGGASISTVVAAFGTASIRNTANSYLLTPASTDFDFADGDFCIEMKVLFASSVSGKDIYFFDRHNVANGMRLELFGSALNFYTNATNIVSFNWAPVAGVQYHLALARVAGTVRCFVDGVVKATATYVGNINTGGSAIRIGNFGTTATFGLDGYIDEFRITKGDGRYSAAFAPPTTPFPDAGPLFYDTFTAANGTTLATHVSDSGHSWVACDADFAPNTDNDGTPSGPADLVISSGRLGNGRPTNWGDGSVLGEAQLNVAVPLDKVTFTITMVAGDPLGADFQYNQLLWPLGDWSQRQNQISWDSAGYLAITQYERYLGLVNNNFPDQLAWAPGSSHTLVFTIGDGQCVVTDNGVEVGTFPWYALTDVANAITLTSQGASAAIHDIDSLLIEGNALAASPPAPNPMDAFPAASGLPAGVTLYEDTFTGTDGTTLATHVADSGQAYAESPIMQTQGLFGPANEPGTRAGLALLGNALNAPVDLAGNGSYCGVAQVAVAVPMTDFCWTAVVHPGGGGLLKLNWPLITNGDPSPFGVIVAIGDQGSVTVDVVDTPHGIGDTQLAYAAATPVEWDTTVPHTVQVAATGGTAYIVIDGTVRASMAWPTLPYAPTVFGLAALFGSGTARYDSLKLQNAAGGGPGPQTGNATGLTTTTAFGTPTNRRTQPATGKASSLAFGLATNRRTQGATGKASGLTFGTPEASVAAASHVASGIPATATFGTAIVRRTQQATALAAQTAFGTPIASVVGGTLSGFVDTFTGAAGESMAAHHADTGETWNDGAGLYTLDSTGTRLLPCFQVTLSATLGVVGAVVPPNAKAVLKFQPPTTGTNPFQVICGSGNAAASTPTFNGAAGLVYNTGGNVQIRWYLSSATSVLIGQLTKAQLGFGLATIVIEVGKITVNGFEFSDPQITGLVEGSGIVLDLYSNTSTSTARPYLESVAVDVAPASNRTGTATGIDSTVTFGVPAGANPVPTDLQTTQAATFKPLRMGVPARPFVQADGFRPLRFGTPGTPVRRATSASSIGPVVKFGEPPQTITRSRHPPSTPFSAQPFRVGRFGVPRKL